MPRVTENYCRQHRHETLADVPRYGDGPRQVRFTHILNPYRAQTEQDRAVQQLTFETLRIAARTAAPAVQVRCVCVTTPGERDVIPPDFIAAESLTRSVLDVAAFAVPRTLPLIFDILDLGIAVPGDAPGAPDCEDFIIFTNMDIHLQPHFYQVLAEFIREGYDIIDIHRRTIPQHPANAHSLPVMYAEAGVHHGGLDCIVFPRKKYPSFIRNNACVGMSLVMKGVLINCAMQAKRFLVLSNSRLTFHLGNDRAWAVPLYNDYTNFNLSQFQFVISEMAKDRSVAARLISMLRIMQLPPRLIRLVEQTAGIRAPRPGRGEALSRRLSGLRTSLLRKAIALLPDPDDTTARDRS